MPRAIRVLGVTLRVLALVGIVAVTLSVATAAEGFTTVGALSGAVAFHAVCAVAGVQLVGLSKRMRSKRVAATTE